MKPLFLCFSENLDYALGWMVVHSLWQATLIAFIAGALNIALRKRSARVRYIVSNVSLLMILAMSVATFCYHYDFSKSASQVVFIPTNETAQAQITQIINPNSEIAAPLSIGGFKDYFNHNLPLIVTIWVLGVALFMLKLLGGVSYIYYLKSRMNFPTDEYWSDMMERLSKQAGIKKSVELVESALVRTPMVIGFLKPMILFPMGVINRLAPQEVEAILAHELAHVLRNDYLFNVMQSVVEALFYFHPAVWWLSGQIRNERESACDEIAIELINSKMNYAKALVTIQEMAYYPMSPALGFAGQRKNQFVLRMQRILNQPNHKSNVMEKLIATLLIVVTLVGLTIGQNQNQPKKEENKNETPQSITTTTTESSQTQTFSNVTTIGDTIGEPFYSTLPPTPEIIELQKEVAQMEKEFPLFEKEQEAKIEKLKKELAEMESGSDGFEKKKQAEIAAIEKEIASMKGDIPKNEKDNEAKIETLMKEIKKQEAELVELEKKLEAENAAIEAKIVEKKKERDGKTGVKRSSVEGDIQGLYGDIQGNYGEIQGKRGEIQGLYGEIQGIKGEMMGNRGELQGKHGEIQGLHGEMQGRRGEIQGKRGEIQGIRGEIQGKRGEIQGKYGEIQGKYSELVLKELVTDLKRDNIIASDSKLYLRLNQKEMFVNEVKQSEAVHLKYKAKYLKGNKRGFEIFKRNGNLNFIMDDDN
jgi:bla regulator protein blaR1